MKQTKHLRQTLWRTLLCLTVMLGFASPGWSSNFNEGETLYFEISSAEWNQAGAEFKANFNMGSEDSGNKIKLEKIENNFYSCKIPGSYSHLQLIRVNPNDNNEEWNKTNNLNLSPSAGQNCIKYDSTWWNGGDFSGHAQMSVARPNLKILTHRYR